MSALIIDDGQWAVKSCQDVFVQELSGDGCHVGAQGLGLDPFGGVIGDHEDISSLGVSACAFNRANEIKARLHEWVSG